jgi:hypothetical protein
MLYQTCLVVLAAVATAKSSVQMKFRADWAAATPLVLDNSTHYEDPKPNGCRSDEEAIQITGVSGDFCTPQCIGTSCPTDVPAGVTATPTCALQDPSGDKFCALMCDPASNDMECGAEASCKPISGVGICTYDD